jgi:hypothetical protein
VDRFKEFVASGTAPNGRLYAGDLLQMQDLVAALSDFSQIVDLGTVRIGDSSIGLTKYGTAEARLTAALRTDGIIRALGGLYAGAFTTVARNAIPSGLRPYGLIILNTTTNRYEWNSGTDASPNWQPLATIPNAVPAGGVIPFCRNDGTCWLSLLRWSCCAALDVACVVCRDWSPAWRWRWCHNFQPA